MGEPQVLAPPAVPGAGDVAVDGDGIGSGVDGLRRVAGGDDVDVDRRAQVGERGERLPVVNGRQRAAESERGGSGVGDDGDLGGDGAWNVVGVGRREGCGDNVRSDVKRVHVGVSRIREVSRDNRCGVIECGIAACVWCAVVKRCRCWGPREFGCALDEEQVGGGRRNEVREVVEGVFEELLRTGELAAGG